MVEANTHPLHATGKDDLKTSVETSKVLVVGAGGIGCELLKNLVLSGFRDIVIIDLDTIDVSNLNRQFLFHKQHVSQSKAKVARESALSFEREAKIEALHDSITSPSYGVNFFKQFTLVMNALDNAAARSHVNRLCLAAEVPLIESGTAGYLGNVSVIKKGVSECFECMSRPTQKSYPGCTIRNTPSEPIHCIVWSKHLFNQLFGEEDADQDVSPDTDDPELGGSAGQRALDNGQGDEEPSKNGNGSENMDVSDAEPLHRVSTKAWARNVGYDAKKLFMKFFNSDIKYLLSMDKLWEKRRPPTPLDCEDLPEEAGTSSSTSACIKDLRMWSLQECYTHFQQAVEELKQRVAKPEGDSAEAHILTWDKDDDASMDFVAACANIRAAVFGIPRKTRFDVKSMAGNIIPAIATTNAVIAGAIVVEAFKVLRGKLEESKSIALFKNPNPVRRLVVASELAKPNPNCAVCAPKPQVFLKCNPETFTVKSLEEKVLKGSLNMIAPDVNVDDGTGTILISSEEGETEENNDKPLKTFKIQDGTRLLCDDFVQNYNLAVVVMATNEPFEDGSEFAVLGKDALDAEMEVNRKKEQEEAAEKAASDAEKVAVAANGNDGPQSIDVEDDDLAFAGEKIYGVDDEDAPEEANGDGEVEERKRKREDEDEVVEVEQPAVKKLKAVAPEEPELVTLNFSKLSIVATIEEVTDRVSDAEASDSDSEVPEEPQYKEARGALRAFQRSDYGTAVKRFTQLLAQGSEFRPKLLLKRAESFFKLELHAEALKDLEVILGVEPDNILALNLKGKVLFACHQFEAARNAFLDVQKQQKKEGEADYLGLKQFLLFCDERIARIEKQKRLKTAAAEEEVERKAEEGKAKMATGGAGAGVAAPPVPPKAPAVKIRHEWYQTDQTVVVTVLVKGLVKDWVLVVTAPRKLKVELAFAEDEKRTLEFDLFHAIKDQETTFKVTPSKVEVKMHKLEAVHWGALEGAPEAKAVAAAVAEARPAYPSSAKTRHNWDALEQDIKKEEADEKLDGDAALQKVFADIYAGASDEAKKAMNKSFAESGGTVLSTNWESVKDGKVDMKPPDGMEFKKWE